MNRCGFSYSMHCWGLITCMVVLLPAPLRAEVVRVEVTERSDVPRWGYEQITGRLHYEVDPKLPGNAVIADVELAPRNADGKVSFSSDFRIWKPKDSTRANGAAWVEVPNRGGRASLNDWMATRGFTLVNVGWEFDVPAESNKLRIEVPRATNPDGSPIRGLVSVNFTPDRRTPEFTLTTLAVYPVVDPEGKHNRLVMRTQAPFPAGQDIPRSQWSLQGAQVRLDGGFEPGKSYDFMYQSEGPPVAGLGYAAMRDAVAWLKNDPASPAAVQHVYAFGSSQCGRFLRDFVYLGFNTDEQDRQVFDGVMSHVAGAGRLVLNQRWSVPRALAGYETTSYPFADSAQADPVSGHTEGILENSRVKHAPRIFYTNMAAEYWGAGRVAALTHVTPSGTQDIPLPDNVRSYFFAGTSHGPARFPPTSQVADSPRANPVNPRASIFALRDAMHLWVTAGVSPPASVYPKLADGTLTPVADVRFPKVPSMAVPNHVNAGGRVRNPQWADGAGEGVALPLLVPQVDADGNDLGGIRMPDLAVPLGTATGWVFRPPEFGSPHEFYLLRGAWIPFARTRADRAAANDPRPSLEERYASKDVYLARVKQVLQDLVQQRLLAEGDLEPELKQAEARWDWVMRPESP